MNDLISKKILDELEKFKTYLNISNSNFYNKIQIVKDKANIMNDDIKSTIISKIFEIKELYTEDLKTILSDSENISINKLIRKIEKENNIIIDILSPIINDSLPKDYVEINLKYDSLILEFKQDININIEDIKMNNISIEKINELIDLLFTNLLNTPTV